MQTRGRAQQGGSDDPLPSQPAREPDPWLTPARVRLKERCKRLLQKLKTQFAAPLASGALTLPSLFQLAGPCTAAGGLFDMYNEQEALGRARELVAAPSGDDAPPAAAKDGMEQSGPPSEEGLTQDLLDDRIAAYPTGDICLDRTNLVSAASLLGAFTTQREPVPPRLLKACRGTRARFAQSSSMSMALCSTVFRLARLTLLGAGAPFSRVPRPCLWPLGF